MQTLSRMRRNSTHQNYLGLVFTCFLLLGALILSSLYPYIPSLVGFLFCYALLTCNDETKRLPLVLIFIYLSYYDSTKGFFLFSYVILFFLFYTLAAHKVRTMTSCFNCILAFYVIVGYLGHYLLNLVLAYITNEPFPYFSTYYFYAIGVDVLLASLFLRDEL